MLTIFEKSFIIDIWQDSKYSAAFDEDLNRI